MSERANPFTISICKLILICVDTDSNIYRLLTAKDASFTLGDMTAMLQRVILSSSPPIAIGRTQQQNSPSHLHHLEQQPTEQDLNPNNDIWEKNFHLNSEYNTACIPLTHLLSQISFSPKEQSTQQQRRQQQQQQQHQHQHQRKQLSSSISHQFWKSLKESASSIDSLIDLFSDLRVIVQKGIVDKNSAQGIFIRRISLGFEELPFEAVGKLWNALHDFVEEGSIFFENKDGGDGIRMTIYDENAPTSEEDNIPSHYNKEHFSSFRSLPQFQNWEQQHPQQDWKPSVRQIERILHKKCLNFDQNIGKPNHSFEQIEAEVQYILTQHPELPAAHFLRFLNCLHHGEHVGAIDSLHRYFDYAMIHERREAMTMATAAAASNAANSNGQAANDNPNDKDVRTSVVQYAAILLAALHHEFGNDFLSTKATEEAIRVAQQSGDTACVAYALAWLHHNNSNAASYNTSPDSPWLDANNNNATHQQAEELLKRCYTQALDHDLTNLASGAHLALARHYSTFSYSGRNVIASCANYNYQPRDTWETLEHTYIHSGGAASHHPPAHPINRFISNHSTAPTITEGSKHMAKHETLVDSSMILSRQNLVASGVWETFGHSPLAGLAAVTALHCYGNTLSTNDFAISVHKIAFGVLNGTGMLLTPIRSQQSGTIPLELEIDKNTSVAPKKRGRGALKHTNPSSTCVYPYAIKKLLHLRQIYPIDNSSPSTNIWRHSVILLLREWSINRNEIHHSSGLNILLQTSSTISQRHQIETSVQSLSQYALSLCHQGSWKQASVLTKRLCITCQNHGLRYHHARLLLQLTLIQLQCSSKHISTITTCVLPPLLECLSLCDNFSMDSLHAAAMSLLAKIYLLLDHPKKAKSILNAVMPLLLQHAPLGLQGEAWLTLAKCSMRELSLRFQKYPLVSSTKISSNAPTTTFKEKRHKPLRSTPHPSCQRSFQSAYSHLEESIQVFQKVQNVKSLRESLYLKARLCHSWGGEKMKIKAKEALRGYREICGHIVTSSTWPVSYDAFVSIADMREMERLIDR